jgi:hypothetical protein
MGGMWQRAQCVSKMRSASSGCVVVCADVTPLFLSACLVGSTPFAQRAQGKINVNIINKRLALYVISFSLATMGKGIDT